MNNNAFSNPFWGIFLVAAGAIWLGANILEVQVDFSLLWPIFLLIPGLALWAKYLFSRKHENYGLLIPANILIFLSITFFFNMVASRVLNYDRAWLLTVSMYSTGPVAIAFWITWSASGRLGRFLVPAVILTIISACIAFITVPLALFNTPFFADLSNIGFPLLLILIGLMVLFGPIWSKAFEQKDEMSKPAEPVSEPEVDEAEIVEEGIDVEIEENIAEPVTSSSNSESEVEEAETIEEAKIDSNEVNDLKAAQKLDSEV